MCRSGNQLAVAIPVGSKCIVGKRRNAEALKIVLKHAGGKTIAFSSSKIFQSVFEFIGGAGLFKHPTPPIVRGGNAATISIFVAACFGRVENL